MRAFNYRLSALLATLTIAGTAPIVVNCGSSGAEEELSEDNIGVSNAMGLGVRYHEKSGSVQATLKRPLEEGERLVVRVRAGKYTSTSQRDLRCTDLSETSEMGRDGSGKIVFQGPTVDRSVFDLMKLYDDPAWATLDVTEAQRELAKTTPDALVEACLMKGAAVRSKMVTNLSFAIDQATKDGSLDTLSGGIRLQAADGGLAEVDAGPAAQEPITEENVTGQVAYGALCEQELGEIPFFPRIKEGSYETFDCRDLVANGRDGNQQHTVEGVEGARIPARVDGVEVDKCDPGKELGPDTMSYNCLKKSDEAMYLKSGDNQPGPMVASVRNSKGTYWALLCRAVADDGRGMLKTKTFNDIAMIGHNPKTGRTCFFQNKIGSGRDGSKVPHPADVDKSNTVWSGTPAGMCASDCHGNSPFIHSKWIDGARRADGKMVVPMLGQHADLPISAPIPYNIVAADHLRFSLPKQLISEEASACTNCHSLTKGSQINRFAKWSVGDQTAGYFGQITDFGKAFKESHWMPLNTEGLTPENFATSKYGKAIEFMSKCDREPTNPACEWADSLRGSHNNPRVAP